MPRYSPITSEKIALRYSIPSRGIVDQHLVSDHVFGRENVMDILNIGLGMQLGLDALERGDVGGSNGTFATAEGVNPLTVMSLDDDQFIFYIDEGE